MTVHGTRPTFHVKSTSVMHERLRFLPMRGAGIITFVLGSGTGNSS